MELEEIRRWVVGTGRKWEPETPCQWGLTGAGRKKTKDFSFPAAAAAKSLQSFPTLCDPRDGSPPGSSVPGILQARTLKWVAISFSKLLSLFACKLRELDFARWSLSAKNILRLLLQIFNDKRVWALGNSVSQSEIQSKSLYKGYKFSQSHLIFVLMVLKCAQI